MNKFLKLITIPAMFLLVSNSTSCTVTPKEIALITDIGDINDGGFNQESWEACKEYGNTHHKSYDFYRPFNDSGFARSCSIKQAVAKGAQVIVLPGFKFADTCAIESKKYPNVHFLLIDSSIPQDAEHPFENVCTLGFKCGCSGFIAGYTVALDLMKRDYEEKQQLLPKYGYGYCGGMAQKGVLEFGFGYIQGICRATSDFCALKGISSNLPSIWINYNYANAFAQDDNAAARMKGWLNSDNAIKVIFPCGGKLYQSATEAVQYYNKHQNLFDYNKWLKSEEGAKAPRDAARWIGVDSDQYRGLTYDYELKSIYTSALKGLKKAISHTLDIHYNGEWSNIGGYREPGIKDNGAEINEMNQWVLGLNSIFGDNAVKERDADDFVGIPVDDYDEETHVIRGFDNLTIEECIQIRNALISEDADRIPIYEGDGTEYGAPLGVPEGIVDWGNGEFRSTYLGNYQGEITVKVI